MDVGQNRRNLWLIKQIQPCRKKNEEARCFEIKTTKHFKLIVFYATSLVVFGFGLLLFFLALLISNSCDDAAGKTARKGARRFCQRTFNDLHRHRNRNQSFRYSAAAKTLICLENDYPGGIRACQR